jgi:O-antigen biosynthesis protein WbqP
MIRIFDILFSLIGILILSPVICAAIIIGFIETRSPLFVQERLGVNQKPFRLLKFRSMPVNTKSVATHLVDVNSISSYGRFLRKSKIDEIPQLWNVLVGEMSIVGPRPNLINQFEVIEERARRGVYFNRPGITGLAQINKIDMSRPSLLAEMDAHMMSHFTWVEYLRYILLTMQGKGFGDRTTNK